MRLAERRRDVGHIPDAEHDRVGVKASIGKGQRLGILLPPDEAAEPALVGARFADFEHVGVDVGDGHMRAAPREAEGDVAGAAGHVEDVFAGPRLYPGDEAVLPQPVHSARHEVVHHIVAARDGAEDRTDASRLLFGRHQRIAEVDLLCHRAAL